MGGSLLSDTGMTTVMGILKHTNPPPAGGKKKKGNGDEFGSNFSKYEKSAGVLILILTLSRRCVSVKSYFCYHHSHPILYL